MKFKDFLHQKLFSTWELEKIDVHGEQNLNLQTETRILQKQVFCKVMRLQLMFFENVNNIFDRNLGSELTDPSQISNEIEVTSQKLAK